MIGHKMGSFAIRVYTTVNTSPVENHDNGLRNDMVANMATLRGGVLRRSSFLGNLKPSYKKLGLRRTTT